MSTAKPEPLPWTISSEDDPDLIVRYLEERCFTTFGHWTEEQIKDRPQLVSQVSNFQLYFAETGNTVLAIEAHIACVDAGMTPPAWVLRAMNEGYKRLRDNPKGDLGTFLGVKASGSGRKPPYSDYFDYRTRGREMADMYKLIRHLDLSQKRASEAVKLRYNLKESASIVRRRYREFWAEFYEHSVSEPDLKDDELIKFKSSFPPKARRLFNKT